MIYLFRNRVIKQCNQELDMRLEILFEGMRQLHPMEPYVRRGEWSWSKDLRVDLVFPYYPLAFSLLTPLDTDMKYCVKYCGKEEWFKRQEKRESLKACAAKAKCPLIFASPGDTLSIEWIKEVTEGLTPYLQ